MISNKQTLVQETMVLTILFILTSCQMTPDPNVPQSFLGKKFATPPDLEGIIDHKKSILIFNDLKGCYSCQIKEFPLWDDFLSAVDAVSSYSEETLNIIFIVNVDNINLLEVKEELRDYFPVDFYYDSSNFFENRGAIPKESQYRCIYLDEESRIQLIGKPIFNADLFSKYIQKLK